MSEASGCILRLHWRLVGPARPSGSLGGPSVGVAVLVGRAVRDLPVRTDLDGAAQLGPHLVAGGEDLHLQDDDHLLGLLANLVADVLLHLDDGEGGQLVVVDHGVELGGQHGETVTKLTITEKQTEPDGEGQF